jgi:hypothetical protein
MSIIMLVTNHRFYQDDYFLRVGVDVGVWVGGWVGGSVCEEKIITLTLPPTHPQDSNQNNNRSVSSKTG